MLSPETFFQGIIFCDIVITNNYDSKYNIMRLFVGFKIDVYV